MVDQLAPYEVVFGRTGMADEYFPRILAAAAELGLQPVDRDRFLALPPVADLLAAITPPASEGGAQIALLAFHSFRRWQQGGDDLAIEAAELTELLGRAEVGAWRLETPAPAGYLRLPRHLLWVAGSGDQPAEPVDGFFWVTGDVGSNALDLLLVLGMHEAREGMTVIELPSGPLPAEGHWGDLQFREDGADFGNVLPGGEHLFGLGSSGEVLKLVSRVFWRLRGDG